jgi:solute carrier family 13 (sodium-dependent dicarboxylate transporter), member 2/3/5
VAFSVARAAVAGGKELLDRELAALGRLSRAEVTVGAIVALTATAWVTQPLLARIVPRVSDAGIAVAGALLLFIVPVGPRMKRAITWGEAERLPWGVLVLFGGGLSLANAVERTGLALWIGTRLSALGDLPIVVVALALTVVIVFLTELTSNTATAATFIPVVAALAVGIAVPPLLLTIPVVLGASCAFMMPVATPPNAIVYASERITIPQMARAGLWLNFVLIAVILGAVFGLGPAVFGW